MAPMNKLDAPTLATPTVVIFISIVEHVHSNCNFRGLSQGHITKNLEGQGYVGVHLGKLDKLVQRNMEDFFNDNENDIVNEARTTLTTKVGGEKSCKPNEPTKKRTRLV